MDETEQGATKNGRGRKAPPVLVADAAKLLAYFRERTELPKVFHTCIYVDGF